MIYGKKIKESILKKVLAPGGASVISISEETGVNKSTIYHWIKKTDNFNMNGKNLTPRKWNFIDKFKNLLESKEKSASELGIFLREKGIHSEHLELWEEEIKKIILSSSDKKKEIYLQKENIKLSRELRRKEKALAELSALLVLKKNFQKLLEDEDDLLA